MVYFSMVKNITEEQLRDTDECLSSRSLRKSSMQSAHKLFLIYASPVIHHIYKILPATKLAELLWGPGGSNNSVTTIKPKVVLPSRGKSASRLQKKNSKVIQRSIQQEWGIHRVRTERSPSSSEDILPWEFWSLIDTYRSACIRNLSLSDFLF